MFRRLALAALVLFVSTASAQVTAPTEPVGTTSPTQTATISFPAMLPPGPTSFTLGSISVVTQGITGLDYNVAPGGTCIIGNAYTSTSTCTVNFTFNPHAPGQRLGAILLSDVSTPTPRQTGVRLVGIGTGSLAAFTPGVLTTVAGNGISGYTADSGLATSLEINTANSVAVDPAGNFYITDLNSGLLRKVNAATGAMSTVAGNYYGPLTLGDNGPATSAKFCDDSGVVVDHYGNLYVADSCHHRIRMVNVSTGIITTVAGNGTQGYNGDNILAVNATLNFPSGVAIDAAGNLYIADGNQRIRKVDALTGIITTVAGTGYASSTLTGGFVVGGYSGDGGLATSAELNLNVFSQIAVDAAGNLFIADAANSRVRKVTVSTGIITTIAGNGTQGYNGDNIAATSAELYSPEGVVVDLAGNVYIADELNSRVRKVSASTGSISTIAGTGSLGYNGETIPATLAQLDYPVGLAFDGAGNLYIADNTRIRKIAVNSAALNFASAAIGSTSADSPKSVILSSIGNVSLVSTAPLTGTNASISTNFTFGSATTCPASSASATLLPGSDCLYSINFSPVTSGLTGNATLVDNALISSQVIALNGASAVGAISITPTTVLAAIQSTPYSVTFTASGGTAPYTYLYWTGAMPSGLTLNTTTGVLSGIPGNTGTFNFGIKAIDSSTGAGPYSIVQSYSLVVGSALAITPTTLPSAIVGTGYTATLTTSGGTAPKTFTVTTGTLPPGFTLSTSGVLSGTPVASGSFGFTIGVVDSSASPGPYSATQAYTLVINSSLGAGHSTAPAEPVNTASPVQTATISFAGSFTLGSISVVTQGATGLDFNAATGGTCIVGNTYSSSASCTVNYTFTPKAPGQRMGAILVYDNSTPTSILEATVYLDGMGNGALTTLTPGIITTVPGTTGAVSTGVVVDSAGNIYIADQADQDVLKVDATTGIMTTIAGTGTPGYNGDGRAAIGAQLSYPGSLALDGAGNLYISEFYGNRIRKITAATGMMTTVAGNGFGAGTLSGGYSGDGGPAVNAELYYPSGIKLDGAGNLYIADYDNARVRVVSATTGIITTIAGNGTRSFSGDTGAATSATLNGPSGIAFDTSGNLYIVDSQNNRVRKVAAGSGTITTVAGNGTLAPLSGPIGDSGPAINAELRYPLDIVVDPAGNFYIADQGTARIRKVSAATGIITTIAGTGVTGYTGDGGAATSATLSGPSGLSLDGNGNLYIADPYSHPVRKVSTATPALTFASTAVGSTSTDSPQSVTLSNIGNATLSAAAPGSGTNASISTSFNFAPATTCPYTSSGGTLTAGADCLYAINFAPSTSGSLTGTATLTDNALVTPQSIALSGTATGVPVSITITPSTLSSAMAGVAYSASLSATGGTAPYAYTLTTGSLPAGLALSTAGVISGTPTAAGTFTFTVKATDSSTGSGPYNGTKAYTLTVAAPTIIVAPSSLSAAAVGTAYSTSITATGGTAAYAYTISAGALPSGLSLSSTGVLSGTPTANGSFSFTVRATDSTTGTGSPFSGTKAYTLTVGTPTLVVGPSSLSAATDGIAYSATFTATGGTAPYTYTVSSGSIPSGLTLSTAGVLSGTPAVSGTFSFTIRATDSSTGTGAPFTATKSYTLAASSAAVSGYIVSANPAVLIITRGNSGTSVLTFSPFGGYQGTANLACSGLPAFATCTFTPSTMTFTGNNAVQTSTLVITTTAGHAAGSTTSSILWLPGTVFAALLFLRRRKLPTATRALLLTALLACLSIGINACATGVPASSPFNGTPLGTDTVQVNVSAIGVAGMGSANVDQSATLTITIQ